MLGTVQSAIDAAYIPAKKFVTMVYDVPSNGLEFIFNTIIDSISGSLFITEDVISKRAGSLPSAYWDELNVLVNTKNSRMRVEDPTCGCTEVDECTQSDDVCPPNAFCQNTVGSFQCFCAAGFVPKIEAGSGAMSCVDDNECANGLTRCDENAFCRNIRRRLTKIQ